MKRLPILLLATLASTTAGATCQSAYFCEHYPDQYGYLCEATLQGGQYSYSWSRTGVANFPYGCTTEFCQVTCSQIPGNGHVILTVTDNSVPEQCYTANLNVCG